MDDKNDNFWSQLNISKGSVKWFSMPSNNQTCEQTANKKNPLKNCMVFLASEKQLTIQKHQNHWGTAKETKSVWVSVTSETKAHHLHQVFLFVSRHDLLTAPNLWQASESFGMQRWKEERNHNENNNHTLRTLWAVEWLSHGWNFRNKKMYKQW